MGVHSTPKFAKRFIAQLRRKLMPKFFRAWHFGNLRYLYRHLKNLLTYVKVSAPSVELSALLALLITTFAITESIRFLCPYS